MHRGIVVLLVVFASSLLAAPASASTAVGGSGEVTGLQVGLAAAAVLVLGLGVSRLRRSRTAPDQRGPVSGAAAVAAARSRRESTVPVAPEPKPEPAEPRSPFRTVPHPKAIVPRQATAPEQERLPRAAVARLSELRQLHEQGRISDEEFLGRTQAVLDAF